MNLICKIFGHNDQPTNFVEWEKTGMNFECLVCDTKWKCSEDIKR